MGAPREPKTPKPYDPDRWAKRWALVGAGLLLLAFVSPEVPSAFDATHAMRWSWELLEEGDAWEKAMILLPLLAVALTADLVFRWRGAKRAVALMAVGGVLTLARSLTFFVKVTRSDAPGFVVLFVIVVQLAVVACIAIGSGNRVRRRWPDSHAARVVPGIAGAFLALVLAVEFVRPILLDGDRARGARLDSSALVNRLWISLLLVYALLAILGLRTETVSKLRGRALGWIAVSIPIAYVAHGVIYGRSLRGRLPWFPAAPPLLEDIARAVRAGASEFGPWILLAVGFAAWLEARIAARDATSNAATVGRVFE